MRVLMITQKLKPDDDLLGYSAIWVDKLAERVEALHVLAQQVASPRLPPNVCAYEMQPTGREGRWSRIASFTQTVAPLVLRQQVDIVFVHMIPRWVLAAAPWCKLAGVPIVQWYAHRQVDSTLRLTERLVARVLTPSAESYQLPSRKVLITGHGVDTDLFSPGNGPVDAPTFVYVGRVSPIKDQLTFVRAIDELVHGRKHSNWQFICVGGIPRVEQQSYHAQVLEMVRQLKLEDNVQFTGAVPYQTVPQYYRRSIASVNLCPTGGMDKAVLESLACGTPAVVCNQTFAPLMGGDAQRLLFEHSNAQELATRLEGLADSSAAERLALGQRLRAAVIREHSVDRLMDLMVTVMERESTRHRPGDDRCSGEHTV
jgi:glycosyltransferase involved in cell wall biosynthesis